MRRLTTSSGRRGPGGSAAATLLVLVLLLVACGSDKPATQATRTPTASPSPVTSKPVAKGRFDVVDAAIKTAAWEAQVKTKGTSDVEVLEVRVQPGASIGWHSHPGPSFVIVQSGTATLYLANDPACKAHVYAAGSGFVDNGGDIHTVRNEGSVELVNIVTALIPAGAMRRIDHPKPGNCAF